jgi:hypothetical protein
VSSDGRSRVVEKEVEEVDAEKGEGVSSSNIPPLLLLPLPLVLILFGVGVDRAKESVRTSLDVVEPGVDGEAEFKMVAMVGVAEAEAEAVEEAMSI